MKIALLLPMKRRVYGGASGVKISGDSNEVVGETVHQIQRSPLIRKLLSLASVHERIRSTYACGHANFGEWGGTAQGEIQAMPHTRGLHEGKTRGQRTVQITSGLPLICFVVHGIGFGLNAASPACFFDNVWTPSACRRASLTDSLCANTLDFAFSGYWKLGVRPQPDGKPDRACAL